jgi:hypothetical protein
MSSVPDRTTFETAYTGQAPWDIGRPQKAVLDSADHLDWDRDARQLSASEDYCWYSWPQQAESMGRLAAYRFEWVLPSHGQRVHLPAADMRQQIERLAEAIRERSQV